MTVSRGDTCTVSSLPDSLETSVEGAKFYIYHLKQCPRFGITILSFNMINDVVVLKLESFFRNAHFLLYTPILHVNPV